MPGNVTGGIQAQRVAFDANGNALAMWTQLQNSPPHALGAYFTPAGGWVGTSIDTAINPQIAFDASGHGVAAWAEPINGRSAVRARRYTPNVGWSAPDIIDTNDGLSSAQNVSLASNASGVVIAVWQQTVIAGQAKSIWARRYTASGGWSAPTPISATDGSVPPLAAVDATGTAMAVWSNTQGSNHVLFWSRSSAPDNSGWSAVAPVGTANVTAAVQLSFAANGNALITWRDSSSSVWSNRFTGIVWGASQKLGAGNFDGNFAFDPTGVALAVWADTDTLEVRYSRTTATGWTAPVAVPLPSSAGFVPLGARVRFGPNGRALVVWQELADRFDIWSVEFTATGGPSGATRIETDNVDASGPQIAFDPQGNAFAIWSIGNSSSSQTMRYARFE
jgi:hypothetical protein